MDEHFELLEVAKEVYKWLDARALAPEDKISVINIVRELIIAYDEPIESN